MPWLLRRDSATRNRKEMWKSERSGKWRRDKDRKVSRCKAMEMPEDVHWDFSHMETLGLCRIYTGSSKQTGSQPSG